MAPPDVSAAMRAPRRPRTRLLTRSRCRCAPQRPRRVAMPSPSMATTSSNSWRGSAAYGRAQPPFLRLLPARRGRALARAAVVRRAEALPDQRLEIVRPALAHAPRRHEDQRRLVLVDERAAALVPVLPRLARRHRRQRLLR